MVQSSYLDYSQFHGKHSAIFGHNQKVLAKRYAMAPLLARAIGIVLEQEAVVGIDGIQAKDILQATANISPSANTNRGQVR